MTVKILTVDDSKTIRMILKKSLAPLGCVVLEGENAFEGLTLSHKEEPDLIILDIDMPGMSGMEMLKKLKGYDLLKKIPVIMLTAKSKESNILKAISLGAADFIGKPFQAEDLLDRVQKVLG